MSGVDRILIQKEYENALKDDKKVLKVGELNELAYEDLIFSKEAFGLV